MDDVAYLLVRLMMMRMHEEPRGKMSLVKLQVQAGRETSCFRANLKVQTKLRGLSPRANYTERPPLVAKLVSTFEDRR
jgi:hypothetical protein